MTCYYLVIMDEFTDDEAPTKSQKKEIRAATLVKNWWACSKADRLWIESLAESLAEKERMLTSKPLRLLGKKK